MNWLKRNAVLSAVLLICAVALAAEVWLLQQARQQAARALADLEQKKQERDWRARQSPAPSEANERAIAQDLAQAGQVLAGLRAALRAGEGKSSPPPPPVKPIDAYFDIAAFVERIRAMAARAQVMIKPDERFGFGTHANEGPEAELVPAVFRQRMLVQPLVEALFESRPQRLLGVQRERPRPAAVSGPGGNMEPGDFFEFVPPSPLRVSGRVESEAFRLEFTGQTPALRAFLNSLAALPRPVVVRSIAVEPITAAPPASLVASPPAPLVAEVVSKFTVVVELVRVRSADGEGGP